MRIWFKKKLIKEQNHNIKDNGAKFAFEITPAVKVAN